ncbi:hypothetical protein [Ruegeria sp. AU67]|nr:hypothetical protein [Ruegeria sp. AU67]
MRAGAPGRFTTAALMVDVGVAFQDHLGQVPRPVDQIRELRA